jgi:hypothetical protein
MLEKFNYWAKTLIRDSDHTFLLVAMLTTYKAEIVILTVMSIKQPVA